MDKKIYQCGFAVLLTLVVFSIVLTVMRPGVFDISTPTHSDIFRYILISESVWDVRQWLQPRPLMLVYLKIASIFGREYFPVLLTIPAVLFGSSIFVVLRDRSVGVFSCVVLLVLMFSSPMFYPQYQYDFGGMLSGFFTVVVFWYSSKLLNKRVEVRVFKELAVAVVLFWISIEIKPAYVGAVVLFALASRRYFLDKKMWWLVCFLAAFVAVFVAVKDVLVGSPFINFKGNSGAYVTRISLSDNLRLFLFYLKAVFSSGSWVVLLVAVFVAILKKRRQLVVTLIAASLGAIAPLCLLVNREWADYAWYALIPLLVIVAVSLSDIVFFIRKEEVVYKKICGMIVLVILLAASVRYGVVDAPQTRWTLTNQLYSKNVEKLIRLVKFPDYPFRNIIVGLHGPYHGLRNSAYARSVNPAMGFTDILLVNSERSWNNNIQTIDNGYYLDELDWGRYEDVYVVKDDGSFGGVFKLNVMKEMPAVVRDAYVFCGGLFDGTSVPKDGVKQVKIVECLNDDGQYKQAVDFSREIVLFNNSDFSWAHFHYSKALLGINDKVAAKVEAGIALKLEPNNIIFNDFVKKID